MRLVRGWPARHVRAPVPRCAGRRAPRPAAPPAAAAVPTAAAAAFAATSVAPAACSLAREGLVVVPGASALHEITRLARQ